MIDYAKLLENALSGNNSGSNGSNVTQNKPVSVEKKGGINYAQLLANALSGNNSGSNSSNVTQNKPASVEKKGRNDYAQLLANALKKVQNVDNSIPTGEKIVNNRGDVDEATQKEINKEARIHAKPYLEAHGYDVSQWEPETSLPDLVGIIKDPYGNPINVVIRSAKQRYVHLSASSFETLMTNPNNLLIVENQQGIRPVTFEELFGNDSNVNLILDARHTPREFFQALGIIFKYVKNAEFVVRDPYFSSYDEIKGFGLEMKNDGSILIASPDDI